MENLWTVDEFALLGHLKKCHSFRMIGHTVAIVYGMGTRDQLIGTANEFKAHGLKERP